MSYAAKPVPAQEEGNPLALMSLILGIIGFLGGCPFSLAAVITGWMGMKREPSGMAKVGFWLGVVGMILQTLAILFILVVFGAALGLTAVEVDSAPPMPAPPVEVEVIELPPMVSESAEALEADPIEPLIEEAEGELDAMPIEPPVEEVSETAP